MSDVAEIFDVFFNGRRAGKKAAGYEYITAMERPSITDNQHPNYPSPLFRQWTAEGWEVVSVTVLPPTSEIGMCKAVGVLRRPASTTP